MYVPPPHTLILPGHVLAMGLVQHIVHLCVGLTEKIACDTVYHRHSNITEKT